MAQFLSCFPRPGERYVPLNATFGQVDAAVLAIKASSCAQRLCIILSTLIPRLLVISLQCCDDARWRFLLRVQIR